MLKRRLLRHQRGDLRSGGLLLRGGGYQQLFDTAGS